MELEEKMIGKLGSLFDRKKIAGFIFCLFIFSSLMAKEAIIENTEYKVSWTQSHDFLDDGIERWPSVEKTIIEQNVFYSLIDPTGLYIDYKDDRFIFTISKGERSLSFDMYNLIFRDVNLVLYLDDVGFWVKEDTVELVYSRRDLCYFFISYDFKNNTVTQKLRFLSPLVLKKEEDHLYQEGTMNIYDFLVNKKVNVQTPCEFAMKDDKSTDWHWYSGDQLLIVNFNENSLVMDIQDTNNNFLGKNPKTIPEVRYRCDAELFIKDLQISTQTYLVEGKTSYDSKNMTEFSNRPWVPSKDIREETIVVKSDSTELQALFIGNGFYNENKPNLYLENNRVKEIEIIYEEPLNITHRVILLDTGYP